MIKMRDFLAQNEVFHDSRPPEANFQRILIISNRDTLVRCKHLAAAVDADAVQ